MEFLPPIAAFALPATVLLLLTLLWMRVRQRRSHRRVASPERIHLVYQPVALGAGTNWTEVRCEIDLRQPLAELELHCEAAGLGEAGFDLRSLRLTRWTDPGRE